MLWYLKAFIKRLTPNYILKQFVETPVVLISFPKCGRTWLRLLISNSIYNEFPPHDQCDVDYLNLKNLHRHKQEIPILWVSHDDNPMYKTKKELVKNKIKYLDKKILFLVRDPRDVLVSWYFQVVKRDSLKHFNSKPNIQEPSDFIYNDRGGLSTLIEFYNTWYRNKAIPLDFHLVRYEELHSNTYNTLTELFQFLGCAHLVDRSSIEYSIEKNRFEKLKQAEKRQKLQHEALKTEKVKDTEAYKVRRGKVGGYKDYLSKKDIQYMNDYINENLADYYSFYKYG